MSDTDKNSKAQESQPSQQGGPEVATAVDTQSNNARPGPRLTVSSAAFSTKASSGKLSSKAKELLDSLRLDEPTTSGGTASNQQPGFKPSEQDATSVEAERLKHGWEQVTSRKSSPVQTRNRRNSSRFMSLHTSPAVTAEDHPHCAAADSFSQANAGNDTDGEEW